MAPAAVILLLKATRLKRSPPIAGGEEGGGEVLVVPRRGGAAGAGEGHLRNEIPKPVGGTAPGLRAGVGAPHGPTCGCSRRSKRVTASNSRARAV